MPRLRPISAPGITGIVASVAALRGAGVPQGRLYARDLSRPLRGIVSAPGLDPNLPEVSLAAVRALMRPGRFLSRRTAAAALGIPILRSIPQVEVGAIRPAKPPQRTSFVGHQVRPGTLERVPDEVSGWLPTAADTWGLLAAVSSATALVVAGDFLISGPTRSLPALCSHEDLGRVVERFAGCAGVGKLREALPALRTGVESPAESQVRCLVVASGLPEPLTCCAIPVDGRVLHSDLGYPELKIAIEYQGAYHFEEGPDRARRDNDRFEAMKDAGWRVLVLTSHDLRDPTRFLSRLRRAIAAASVDPRP